MKSDGPDFLGSHMIPVVIGPKQVPWLIDHHHLARALLEEGVAHVLVSIVARLNHLDQRTFLTYMDNRNWLHPFNAKGERCAYSDVPKRLSKLTDDPYRVGSRNNMHALYALKRRSTMPFDLSTIDRARTTFLPRRGSLVLDGVEGTIIVVDSGCLWVTLERDPRDI